MPNKPFLVKQKKIIKKKQRHRKSQEENKVLMLHFKRNKKWDKKKMEELIQLTGLKASQIYKWKWDMQHRDTEKPNKVEPKQKNA